MDSDLGPASANPELPQLRHRLRTPISAIIGFTQLISEEGNLNPAQRECRDAVLHAAAQLLDIADEIVAEIGARGLAVAG
jgi:signal transduction histidine kinase